MRSTPRITAKRRTASAAESASTRALSTCPYASCSRRLQKPLRAKRQNKFSLSREYKNRPLRFPIAVGFCNFIEIGNPTKLNLSLHSQISWVFLFLSWGLPAIDVNRLCRERGCALATVSSSSRAPSCMINATSPAAKISPMQIDAMSAMETSTSAAVFELDCV